MYRLPMYEVARMLPAPLPPETTRFTTFFISGAAMYALRQWGQQLYVLMPKTHLPGDLQAMQGGRRAFNPLEGGLVDNRDDEELAFQIHVNGHEPVKSTTATLVNMKGVHRFNDSQQIRIGFPAWIRPLL